MVAASMYEYGKWSDQPECVHPFIRTACILFNDTLPSDEAREQAIGPHLFAPLGTKDIPDRDLYEVFQSHVGQYCRSINAFGSRFQISNTITSWEEWNAGTTSFDIDSSLPGALEALLEGILAMCALSTPIEVDAERKESVLQSLSRKD